MKSVNIATHNIAMYSKPFVIAEVGANFNGDFAIAEEMIVKAKEASVDAVKFQSWTKSSLFIGEKYKNLDAELKVFGHSTQEDLLDYLSLSEEDHHTVKAMCDKHGILFSSTPVSSRHVDLLVDLDVPFIKIASMDLNHLSLVEYVSKTGKPTILSTGMGTAEEVDAAVKCFLEAGNDQLILLHCTALYPPQDDEINLNNIDYLAETYDLPIGYSDHSVGVSIPIASAVKGAAIIEKHYTLDKSMDGWDHAVSATPEEFATLVKESARIVTALGHKTRVVTEREEANKSAFRRSIVTAKDLKKGDTISFEDLDFKRPGSGIPVDQYKEIIGKKMAVDKAADTLLEFSDFE